MGRYYVDKKPVAEDYLQLSINKLRQMGYLKKRTSGSVVWKNSRGKQTSAVTVNFGWGKEDVTYMRLRYTQGNPATKEKHNLDYRVELTETPCNFGWHRYWFKCPLYKHNGNKCGRRVEKLYMVGNYFGCRYCYSITYASRNETKRFREYPCRILADDEKRERLLKRMKYRYYAGKPTKTYRKVLDLQQRLIET